MSWTEPNCTASWKGETIGTSLQSAIRGSQAIQCHGRLCHHTLCFLWVLGSPSADRCCPTILFRVTWREDSQLRCSGVEESSHASQGLQLGSEWLYPLRDFVTYQSEQCSIILAWSGLSSCVLIEFAQQQLFLHNDGGGSGFSKIMPHPAHWSWNSTAIPPGHHASLITWTHGRKKKTALARGEEGKKIPNKPCAVLHQCRSWFWTTTITVTHQQKILKKWVREFV